MSDSVNHSKEECLIKMTLLLDASFGNQGGSNNHVNIIRNSILHLKNSLGFEKAEEVAQLVLKGHSEESIKELLKRNFPSGVSIGNVEEILQLVYVGTDTENLKKAINFVQCFDACHQAHAYMALYDEVKFKKHTEQPEMLLLQKKIRQLVDSGRVLNKTKVQVDADCRKIISRIGEEIRNKDCTISEYVGELENALLNDNMVAIVQEFYTGTLENTQLLMRYSEFLPSNSNRCYLIDALMKELQKRKLLASEQAMQIWALARFTKEEIPIEFSKLPARDMMLCSNVIQILSVNKKHFFRLYEKNVENCDNQKITNLHLNNRYLRSIVREFVSFYFNGDVKRTNNLLDSAYKITNLDSVGLILSQLHEEMAKSAQLNSYEAFRLFNLVNFHMSWNNDDFTFLSSNDQEPFEQLKEKARVCLQQLLWQEHTTKFQVVNKFFNATLSSQEDNNIVCFDLGDKKSNQTWTINIGKWTSLLILTHVQKKLQLGTDKESSPCLLETAEPWWKVKMVDEHHFKIFHETKGVETFLTVSEKCGKGCHSVCLRKENNTDMQLWRLQPPQ